MTGRTGEDRPLHVRRILVAIDASADSLAGLDAAVRLAAELGAEVLGLFVEDVELLRVARLEVSRRVVPVSGDPRDLEPGELERHLRAQSRRARRELRMSAEHFRVPWSFRTSRGRVAREIVDAAREVDLVTVGATGSSPQRAPGSTVRALLSESDRPVLVLRRDAPLGPAIHALHDGSPDGAEAVRTAAGLCREGALLEVLVGVEAPAEYRRIRDDVSAWLQGHGIEGRFRHLPGADVTGICGALAGDGGLLVAPGPGLAEERRALGRLLRRVGCPVILVGGRKGGQNA